MSADLIAFYRARLDEDEAAARAYVPVADLTHRHAEGIGWREHNHMAGGLPHQHDPETGFQVWTPKVGDPHRALREVQADRQLLATYAAVAQYDTDDPEPEFASGRAAGLGEAVRIRAARFSGHPDYQAGWKP